MAGFLSPDNGQILLDKYILNNESLSMRTKQGISYLPQEASIFRDLTVYDNIFAIAELFHDKKNSINMTENLIKQFSLKSGIIFFIPKLKKWKVVKNIKLILSKF